MNQYLTSLVFLVPSLAVAVPDDAVSSAQNICKQVSACKVATKETLEGGQLLKSTLNLSGKSGALGKAASTYCSSVKGKYYGSFCSEIGDKTKVFFVIQTDEKSKSTYITEPKNKIYGANLSYMYFHAKKAGLNLEPPELPDGARRTIDAVEASQGEGANDTTRRSAFYQVVSPAWIARQKETKEPFVLNGRSVTSYSIESYDGEYVVLKEFNSVCESAGYCHPAGDMCIFRLVQEEGRYWLMPVADVPKDDSRFNHANIVQFHYIYINWSSAAGK